MPRPPATRPVDRLISIIALVSAGIVVATAWGRLPVDLPRWIPLGLLAGIGMTTYGIVGGICDVVVRRTGAPQDDPAQR